MISANSYLCSQRAPSHTIPSLPHEINGKNRRLAEVKQDIKRVKKHSKLRRMIEAPKDALAIIRRFRQLQGFIHEIVVRTIQVPLRDPSLDYYLGRFCLEGRN
jgi:hypothetical protein